MLQSLLDKVIKDVLRTRWIVCTDPDAKGELGIRIAGVNLWYYKWSDPMISLTRSWRFADKREFGEVVLSQK